MAAKYAGGANEQATALHQRRLEAVTDGAGYFGFDAPRGIVVHVVPTGVYDDGYAIDLGEHSVLPEADPMRPKQLPVLGRDGARGSWTADGFGATVEFGNGAGCSGYAHLFSNGVVESVSAIPFEKSETDRPRIDGRSLELDLTRSVRRYLRVLAYHQRTAPIYVAFTMYGVDGCLLATGTDGNTDDTERSFRDPILAPFPVTLDNFDADVRAELADPIDALWRGAGYPNSPFFESGKWELRSAFDDID